MVPKTSYPPAHHHPSMTKVLTPAAAQTRLAVFLSKTQNTPYLHPDALLSASGISYSAQSGPSGGLAIHHLKRIEAGLRGENLVAESREELARYAGELPEGDDARLNALIAEKRLDGDVKRKRSTEDVGEWAEEGSEAVFGGNAQAGAQDDEWEDPEDYAREQRLVQGEVGQGEGAPRVRQNGAPPKILQHDRHGLVKSKAALDKAARKAAKRARRVAEKSANVPGDSVTS